MPKDPVATAATIAFFGGATTLSGGALQLVHAIRPPLVIGDVPADETGLQLLASGGRWQAVAALAERLESQNLDGVTMLPTEASLRCTVTRVQAYIKLEQYDSARRLFETLGNLNDSRFSRPVAHVGGMGTTPGARRSIVPFTLLFLQAQLPGLCGHLAESQGRLYGLLRHCDAQQLSGSGLLWRNRSKRIRRALVANHFELEQFASALKMQRELADTETNELNHMLAMQHLGCMCLRSGNSFLATEVFKALEHMPVDDESLDPATNDALQQTKVVVCAVNHALLLSFHGYFIEACATLRNVMSAVPVSPAVATVERQAAAAAAPAGANMNRQGAPLASASRTTSLEEVDAVRQQMRRYAVNSLVACVPFFHRNDAPDVTPVLGSNASVSIPTVASMSAKLPPQAAAADNNNNMDHPLAAAPAPPPPLAPPLPSTNVQALIRFLEDHIRADPRGMLLLDATVVNLARLYDLENAVGGGADAGGGSGSRQDQLENLLEQFRGSKESRGALKR